MSTAAQRTIGRRQTQSPIERMTPEAQAAFAQELLHQTHLYRQNAALKAGLPLPAGPERIKDYEGMGMGMETVTVEEHTKKTRKEPSRPDPPQPAPAPIIDTNTEGQGSWLGSTPAKMLMGAAMLAALAYGGPGILGFLSDRFDTDKTPPVVVAPDTGGNADDGVIDTSGNDNTELLHILEIEGYHKTRLGETMNNAFENNPQMRHDILKMIEEATKNQNQEGGE